MSGCFGLALGTRYGVAAMAVGAMGVPLGLGAVMLFGGPALYVAVAHADLPVSARSLGAALASAVGVAGIVLGGLAPAVTLLSVSVDTAFGAAVTGVAGLALGLALSLLRFLRDMRVRLGDNGRTRSARWAMLAFAGFSAALAARIWWVTIPMLGKGA
jgi:hypothetical protein